MALDQRYIASSALQQYLVDKDSGAPLAGGKIFFYSDVNRTTFKNVYQLTGTQTLGYSFVPLPNPLILNSVGVPVDNNGNELTPYYFPFESDGTTQELYYVVIQSSAGVPQYTLQAWPPNSEESPSPSPGQTGQINLIPNGQFLAHNSFISNPVGSNTTVIAPGGWEFVMPSMPNTINSVTFIPVSGNAAFSDAPPQSPAAVVQVACTSAPGADTKYLRIKFNDCNKFASDTQQYTYGFWANSLGAAFNVFIVINKYFGSGGSIYPSQTISQVTISPGWNFINIPAFVFGSNSGYTIGTGQTYVAIDIQLPSAATFSGQFTDFVLVDGNVSLNDDFIVQTNSDMLNRSVAGWMDVPDPLGNSLYLPLVNTPYGTKWDDSEVGMIKATVNVGTLPSYKDCDGSAYITANYDTTDKIPYRRLFNKLFNNGNSLNIPIYGTGSDYLTTYISTSTTSNLIITTNETATGSIPAPTDGAGSLATGFTFNTSPYLAVSSGYGISTYLQAADTILAIGNSVGAALATAGAGTSGFTISQLINTALLKQQFTVQTVAAAGLANPGGAGKYFTFSNTTTNYYVWFKFTNETDPAPGGTGIQVNLITSYTASEVAKIVAAAMNNKQTVLITCTSASTIPAGSYFQIETQSHIYWVWYKVSGSGTAPTTSNILIEVDVSTSDTAVQVATATQIAMNSYQYAVPDFRGMFLRSTDGAGNDPDSATRYSQNVFTLFGNSVGTFEQYQIQSHFHQNTAFDSSSAPNQNGFCGAPNPTNPSVKNSTNTGGNETRPINAYVRYVIKY